MNAKSKPQFELGSLHDIVSRGPYIRGSKEWVARERARQILGAACISIYEIPPKQAYGEPDAHKQQIDTSKYRDIVRAQLRERRIIP